MLKFILLNTFYFSFLLLFIKLLHIQFSLSEKFPEFFSPPSKNILIITYEDLKTPAKDLKPLSNSHYPYKFSPLHQDSTSNLDLSKYKCNPFTFGYSKSEGFKVFPNYTYPDCSLVTNTSKSLLEINRENNTLIMTCPNNLNSFYFSGPTFGNNFILRPATRRFKLNKYVSPVPADLISFGLGMCTKKHVVQKNKNENDRNSVYDVDKDELQHADMDPIFKPRLLNSSLESLKGSKPKLIFLLTLDSISRRHFYRKLPELVQFLNKSESEIPHMSLYDFKIHSTYGSDSVHNQIPIFAGKDYEKIIKKSKTKDKLGQASMWSKMSQKGYITVMGFDDCDSWFPKLLGPNLNVDYMIRQFYCLVDVYDKVKTEKINTEQRCLGPYQTHHYMLNYTMKLIEMYKTGNMWIYLHLNAGHERTGQHANTLDKDLTQFLKTMFEATAGTNEVFLLLNADHGMRYGDWYDSIEAFQETTLPSLFLAADKGLLGKYKQSFHCLEENSKRLTSKLDIRKTILSLIYLNDDEEFGVNLLQEIASYSRTCEDINSDPLYCACSKIKLLDSQETFVRKLLNLFKQKTEEKINKSSFNNPKYKQGFFCDQVLLDKLKSAYHMYDGPNRELFRIQFASSHFPLLNLQVNVKVSLNESEFELIESKKEVFTFLANGHKYMAAVRII